MTRGLIDRRWTIPDQGLGSDVDVPGPRDRAVHRPDSSKEAVLLGDSNEHWPIQQVRQVAIDDGTVAERQATDRP